MTVLMYKEMPRRHFVGLYMRPCCGELVRLVVFTGLSCVHIYNITTI